jgi:hypothetical protein
MQKIEYSDPRFQVTSLRDPIRKGSMAATSSDNDISEILVTPLQPGIAGICDLLRLERVGLHDNFFDLGGNSLLLAKLHACFKHELGGDLTLIEFFRKTTIAAQADWFSSIANVGSVSERAQAPAVRKKEVHG